MDEIRTRVLYFDWKANVDVDALAADLRYVSGGTVHLHEVDLGTEDTWAVMANRPLTPDEVQAAFDAASSEV